MELGVFDIRLENYGNPVFLPSLSGLWDYQVGYRFDGRTMTRVDDWDNDWLVVADQGADPFIFSLGTGRILFDYHGQGRWHPAEFFPDILTMITSLAILADVVNEAGIDFTDDNSYVRDRYREVATIRLSESLGSPDQASSILSSFGWLPD